jgi:hypothetical protein
MLFARTALASFVGLAAMVLAGSAHAMVVAAELDRVNNGNVITAPSEIIDVAADDGLGPAWRVTVGGGLNFEQFFFNYSQPLLAGDVLLTGSSAGQWSADTNGGTASNFGQFSFKWDGPVSGGLSQLTFDILAAGDFLPNSNQRIFAAKIASEQAGNAGGFVSTGTVSAVPLPAAGWLFLTALMGFLGWSRSRRPKRRFARSFFPVATSFVG